MFYKLLCINNAFKFEKYHMKKYLKILFVLNLSFINAAWAEDFYISDQLEVPVRAGSSDRFKVIKMLSSGTQVKVLEKNSKTGYTLISADNSQGWVLNRYLMDEPSARNYISDAKEKFGRLDEIQAELKSLQAKEKSYISEIEALKTEKQSRIDELVKIKQVSANSLAIDTKNQELSREVSELTKKLDNEKTLNIQLKSENVQEAWMTGSLITIVGFILGIIVLNYNRRPKRDRYY